MSIFFFFFVFFFFFFIDETLLYVNFDDRADSWNEARQYCQTNFGTDLAIIDSAAKQNVVDFLYNTEGGNLAYAGGITGQGFSTFNTWVWWNGVEFYDANTNTAINGEYNAFASPEPNNSNGNERCLEVQPGLWNDINCNIPNHAFFCDVGTFFYSLYIFY